MRAVGRYRVWRTRQGSSARIPADEAAIATHSAIETSSADRRPAKRSTPPAPAQPSVPVLDSSVPPLCDTTDWAEILDSSGTASQGAEKGGDVLNNVART